jgi:uncharacterized protein
MSQDPSDFLGTGWSFPPSFTVGGAEVEMVSGPEDVHQSLQILLLTNRDERPMQESFGCGLDTVVFEEMDAALLDRVNNLIYDTVLLYEPRVDLCVVDARPGREPGVLEIRIEYAIRGSNSRFNMVFPFYLNEAVASGS